MNDEQKPNQEPVAARSECSAGLGGTIRFDIWFRESTSEWVCEFTIKYLDQYKTCRTTGKTKEEARNSGFACIGYQLMECVWDDA